MAALLAAALLIGLGEGPAPANEDEPGRPLAPASLESGGRHHGVETDPKDADRWADLGGEADAVAAAGRSVPGMRRAAVLAPDPASAGGLTKRAPDAAGPDPDAGADESPDAQGAAGDTNSNANGGADGETGVDAEGDSEADADGDVDREAGAEAEADAQSRARIAALCGELTAAADRHAVPHDFFIRLIWKESRFDAGAVSPVGAQGIAQFMPGTARARGLDDPFDPDQALPASAHFLRDLKNQFGVWGLAAAGYNAGPNRVLAYLAGRSGLPYETLDFVYSITGRDAGYWKLRAGRLKAARPSPPWAPRPLPRRSQTIASPKLAAKLAPDVAVAKAATPAIAPSLATSAQARAANGGGAMPARGASAAGAGTTVEATGVKMAIHRPRITDGPPDDLGPSPVPGIVVHRPNRSGRGDDAVLQVAMASTAASAALPRQRPEIEPRPVDCARLIVALGRARTTPRPAFGGGVGGGWSPWGAQVAGHPRRDIALRQFGRHRARLPGDLQSPSVVVRRFPARGRLPIHAVQFGAGTRSEAKATCARVAKALVPCVVVKNR